jgi:hypothetical protein
MRLVHSENIVWSLLLLLLEGIGCSRVWRIEKGEFIVYIQRSSWLRLLLLRLLLLMLLLLGLLLLLISSRKGVCCGGTICLCKECAGGVDGVRIECIWGWYTLLLVLRLVGWLRMSERWLGTRLLLLLGMKSLLTDFWEA